MDLLFNRYANPFLLIDNLIITHQLSKFILEFIDIINDEEIYDIWLHRIFDKSFSEFKNEVLGANEKVEISNDDVETTIKDSYEILNNFKPS